MSNHILLIANSPEGHLSETLRDFKNFTTRTITDAIKEGNEGRRDWMLNWFGYKRSSIVEIRTISCGRIRTMLKFFIQTILLRRSWNTFTIILYEQE